MTAPKPMPAYSLLSRDLMYEPETGKLKWMRTARGRRRAEAGSLNKTTGRWTICFKGETYLRSRIAYYLQTGTDPGKLQIDHINHDPSDDRWSNLRAITRSANCFARRAHNKSTGLKGVYERKLQDGTPRYDTMVCWKRKTHYLGTFSDKGAASLAVAKFYRDKGVINFQTPKVRALVAPEAA